MPTTLTVYKELSAMIFIDNKYTRRYNLIILSAQNRVLIGYKEKHHIIPKSIGGTDSKINIVELTAREHFICHLLLRKMVIGNDKSKMALAAFMLTTASSTQQRYKITNRRYEILKKEFSEAKKNNPSPKKGKKITDPIQLAAIKAAVLKREERYKSGEMVRTVGKYIRTEEHRTQHAEAIKSRPNFTTKNYKHTDATKKKIGLANTKPTS
jgi:hypothetical protein